MYMFLIEVVDAFKKENLDYAIAGGYAVAFHGVVRGTLDIDVVIALKKQTYQSCEKALRSLGLESKLPVSSSDMFSFRKEYIEERNVVAWSFFDPKDPSRIVDVIVTFDRSTIPVKNVKVQGRTVPILAKKELILMKKQSGRPQDLEDIRALESIK